MSVVGTCYGYSRVSTTGQDDGGEAGPDGPLGAGSQRSRIVEAYEGRFAPQGYRWGGVMYEPAVRGATPFRHRKVGGELDKLLRRGDIVIVPEVSRGWRVMGDCFATCHDWQTRGIRVFICNFWTAAPLDTTDEMGMMMLFIAAQAASMERRNLGQRIKAAGREAAKHNRSLHNPLRRLYKVHRELQRDGRAATLVWPNVLMLELADYLVDCRAKGYSSTQVEAYLRSIGWRYRTGGYITQLTICLLLKQYEKFTAMERAAGADWRAGRYLMRSGEVWTIDRFPQAVQKKLQADIRRLGLRFTPTPGQSG